MRGFFRAIDDVVYCLWVTSRPVVMIFRFFRFIFGSSRRTKGYVFRTNSAGKKIFEHRKVAEKILHRKLRYGEVVHHINGRRNDNRPSNLCVMDEIEHVRYHKWYDWIYATYGRYPTRQTQLRKLTTTFRGRLLDDN